MGATKTVAITPEMRDVLSRATIEDRVVRLPPGQLDRKLYESIDKALKALGGKWNRKAAGHVFANTVDLIGALQDGSVVDVKRTYEQFWTPPDLVRRLCDLAGDFEGQDVLEPSAGKGAILHEIRVRGGFPTAIEYDAQLACELEAETEGRVPICVEDFLGWRPRPPYTPAAFDLVLMNPPFSKGQDVRHVLHAHSFLKPDGRLVAIMSPHWRFAEDTISRQFRDFVDSVKGVWRPVPGGSFKTSGTGVEAGILLIKKGD